jgi:hypothetical protein
VLQAQKIAPMPVYRTVIHAKFPKVVLKIEISFKEGHEPLRIIRRMK